MRILIIGLTSFFMTFTSFSKEIVVEMLNKRDDGQKMVFSEDVVKVDVGDTIKWVATNKGHNVEFIAGPDGASLPPKSGLNKDVSMTFEKAGVYLYICTPHKVMGMIGLVIVGNDTSNKDAIAGTKMIGRGKKKLASMIGSI
ncbi:MAG: Pseudoazurin [Alphaproteobacteria bacterium MarineAlpha9_Bin4]|nr:pseudoazurin [Pelagibacterales bacterium]PPR27579.1 MAG: Pseudoazurin [Alphaproteobacteria bacterium MarineAlpha9_Bin4]